MSVLDNWWSMYEDNEPWRYNNRQVCYHGQSSRCLDVWSHWRQQRYIYHDGSELHAVRGLEERYVVHRKVVWRSYHVWLLTELRYNIGWKPRRSIMFASWDGEEYGIIGSIEWLDVWNSVYSCFLVSECMTSSYFVSLAVGRRFEF